MRMKQVPWNSILNLRKENLLVGKQKINNDSMCAMIAYKIRIKYLRRFSCSSFKDPLRSLLNFEEDCN